MMAKKHDADAVAAEQLAAEEAARLGAELTAGLPALVVPPVVSMADFGCEPRSRKGFFRAVVNVPGSHVGEIECEIPDTTPVGMREQAAIEAAKVARGIVSFGAAPQVEFPTE